MSKSSWTTHELDIFNVQIQLDWTRSTIIGYILLILVAGRAPSGPGRPPFLLHFFLIANLPHWVGRLVPHVSQWKWHFHWKSLHLVRPLHQAYQFLVHLGRCSHPNTRSHLPSQPLRPRPPSPQPSSPNSATHSLVLKHQPHHARHVQQTKAVSFNPSHVFRNKLVSSLTTP